MIDNKNKVAVIFGVRNESSIAFQIALKLHLSGCKVAVSYTQETKNDVLEILKLHQIESITQEVDVKNEQEIASFLNQVFTNCGPINYMVWLMATKMYYAILFTVQRKSLQAISIFPLKI
jgi:enoyl-[acyl-carrier protein] reductase I